MAVGALVAEAGVGPALGDTEDPLVLVAGARAGAIHELLRALLRERHRVPHTPRGTFLVMRSEQRTGPAEITGTVEGARAPRRVDFIGDDPLLARLTLVAARAVTAEDAEHHGLLSQLLVCCGAVVLVTDGRCEYHAAELELLAAALTRGRRVFLAVTHPDEASGWAEVVRANQRHLARLLPDLTLEPWYAVTRSRSGVPDLRRNVLAWAGESTASRRRAVADDREPPVRVADGAVGSGWRELLDREADRARDAVARCAEREMARLRALVDGPSVAAGSAGPAERLGLGLATLSVALAAEVRATVDALVTTVLRRVLAEPPDARALERVRTALRRDMAARCCDLPVCYRALRVTATAAAAVGTSREPVSGLATHAEQASGVLPPLGIGLTANCLPMVRVLAAGSVSREREWVERALTAVERGLTAELNRQLVHLHEALDELIMDGLDHDLLLV